jgi:hypothetical protein
MPDGAPIVVASMRLRAVSPEAWEQMVLAVREYAAHMAMEMIRCPPDSLQRVQGMAQMAQDLSTLMMDAPKTYERMQGMRKQA